MLLYTFLFCRQAGAIAAHYRPPELSKGATDGPVWAVDAWGLGCLMQEAFNGRALSGPEQLTNTTAIPKPLVADYQKLLTSSPAKRLNPDKVIPAVLVPCACAVWPATVSVSAHHRSCSPVSMLMASYLRTFRRAPVAKASPCPSSMLCAFVRAPRRQHGGSGVSQKPCALATPATSHSSAAVSATPVSDSRRAFHSMVLHRHLHAMHMSSRT